MITFILLCTIAAVCFVLFELRKLRRGAIPTEQVIEQLDLEALYNLIDERQAEFVRKQLSPADYRLYQRRKVRVLLGYLRLMSAFLETRVRSLSAPSQQAFSNPEQLDSFIEFRQMVLLAEVKLWIFLLVPYSASLLESAQQQCRSLAKSVSADLMIARTSLAS